MQRNRDGQPRTRPIPPQQLRLMRPWPQRDCERPSSHRLQMTEEAQRLQAWRTWRQLPLDGQDQFVRLLSGLWNGYAIAGDFSTARRWAARIHRIGARHGRPSLQAEGLLGLGICGLASGDLDSALMPSRTESVRYSARQAAISAMWFAPAIPFGSAYRLEGDQAERHGGLARARAHCLAMEDPILLAGVSLNLGNVFLENGDLDSRYRVSFIC